MAEGILKNCTFCNKEKNCCCNFNAIDLPILNNSEYKMLVNKLNKKEDNFKTIDSGCYNIVADNGVCPFYKNKCTIYNCRPNDCKLFPFDIKFINDTYYLVLYKLDCFNNVDMLKENVDDIVSAIKPYIKTFTSKELNQKMNSLDYIIIKQISEINKNN